ncbi:MAG: WbqC-like protein family, partial [Bacteroidota bacterium]
RFQQKDIELSFLKANNIEYSQAGDPFIPFLSIIDVMMYNSLDKITDYLTQEFTIQ